MIRFGSNEVAHRFPKAFSLIEMLVVVGIIGTLLALAAPALLTFSPSRKTTIHELAGTLEFARAEAVARQSPVFIAFADSEFPTADLRYRAYGLFLSIEEENRELPLHQLRQISPWQTLREGIIFVDGDEFETIPPESFSTILDSTQRRFFNVKDLSPGHLNTGFTSANLPFIAFGARGEVLAPEFFDADKLNLGIAEGFYDSDEGRIRFTGSQPGKGGGEYPLSESLNIAYYTGNVSILTD
ncbi:MAG: prepilin-type N-terminal cleavage/methylation domain-containing protein [Verrucomicrobiota bacterium]